MTQHRPVVATKKPAKVEAWRYDGTPESASAIVGWINTEWPESPAYMHPHENIIVLGNDIDVVKPGMWVIRDTFNDFWPLPDDVYHAVYESPIPL